ncbi:TPR repeat protein [Chitinispirillum alkaliphilum]|nr:TPR repeat protein [Chitinispirillum alkaliphilum]
MNIKTIPVFLLIFLFSFPKAEVHEKFRELFESEDFPEMIKYAREFIPAQSRDYNTWLKLGRANEALNRREKALACYVGAAQIEPLSFEANIGMARIYNDLNIFINALSSADKALEIDPVSADANWEKSRALLGTGDSRGAREYLERAAEAEKPNFSAQRKLGLTLLQENETQRALLLLRNFLSHNSDSEVSMIMARLYIEMEKPDSAIVHLRAASRNRHAPKAEALPLLGRMFYTKGDYRASSSEFERANRALLEPEDLYFWASGLEKTGENLRQIPGLYRESVQKFGDTLSSVAVLARERAGRIFLEKREYDFVVELLLPIYRKEDTRDAFEDLMLLLAKGYIGLDETGQAIRYLEKTTSSQPQNIEAHTLLADLYFETEQTDDALEILKRLTVLEPQNAQNHQLIAEHKFSAGDFPTALEHFKESFSINPGIEPALGIMQSALKLGNKDQALAGAEKALELDRTLVEPAIVAAEILIGKNQYLVASEHLIRVTAHRENDLSLWRQLALCLYKLGRETHLAQTDLVIIKLDELDTLSRKRYLDYAIKEQKFTQAYETAAELRFLLPEDGEVVRKMYQLSLWVEDTVKSVTHLRDYLELAPGDSEAHRLLGNLLLSQGDSSGAFSSFETAVRVNPEIDNIYHSYAPLAIEKELPDEQLYTILKTAVSFNEADHRVYSSLGEIYLRKEKFSNAVENFEISLSLYPSDLNALSNLAYSQIYSGDINGAIITFEQTVTMAPDRTDELRTLGDLYLRQEQMQQAASAYKRYLQTESDNQLALFVADFEFETGNFGESVIYYDRITGEKSQTASYLLSFATASFHTDDFERAYSLLTSFITLEPEHAEAFRMLYLIQKRADNRVGASQYLARYTELEPSDAAMQRTLADLHYDIGQFPQALQSYRNLLKADPEARGFYKRYTELLSSTDNTDELYSALENAVSYGEADAYMYYVLGSLQMQRSQYQSAIQNFEEASALEPSNSEYLSMVARSQLKSNQIGDAIVTFEEVVALDPQNYKKFKLLGDLYLGQDQIAQSMNRYREYLKAKPDDEAVALIVGQQAFRENDHEVAVRYLSKISDSGNRTPSFLRAFSVSAFATDNPSLALSILQELKTHTPDDPNVYSGLYEACIDLNKYDKAVEYLRRYVSLSPEDIRGRVRLGDLLYQMESKQEAFEVYKPAFQNDFTSEGFGGRFAGLAVEFGSDDLKLSAIRAAHLVGEAPHELLSVKGEILIARQDYQNAAEAFQTAAQFDPSNWDYVSRLAYCNKKMGRKDDALLLYQQASVLNPSSGEEYGKMGEILLSRGDEQQAIEMFERYLRKVPTDSETALMVGEYKFRNEDFESALNYLYMVSHERSSQLLYRLGISAKKTGRAEFAIEILEEHRAITSEKPFAAEALRALALVYDRNEQPQKAKEILSEFINIPGVKDPNAAYRLANLYEESNPEKASGLYLQNTQRYSDDYRNFLKMGIYYSHVEKNYSEAISMLQRGAGLNDTLSRIWYELGFAHGQLGEDTEMLEAFGRFLHLDNRNVQPLRTVGRYLMDRNYTSHALPFLQIAHSADQNDLEVLSLLAQGYKAENRPDEAVEYLGMAARLADDSSDENIRITIAKGYYELGMYREAANKFREILRTRDDLELRRAYVFSLYSLGWLREALTEVERIRDVEPFDLETIMIHGEILVAGEEFDEAAEVFQDAIDVDPEYAPALCRKADVYFFQNRIPWARTFYQRALRADQQYVYAELGLARLARLQKNEEKYREHIQRARNLDPENEQVLSELRN